VEWAGGVSKKLGLFTLVMPACSGTRSFIGCSLLVVGLSVRLACAATANLQVAQSPRSGGGFIVEGLVQVLRRAVGIAGIRRPGDGVGWPSASTVISRDSGGTPAARSANQSAG